MGSSPILFTTASSKLLPDALAQQDNNIVNERAATVSGY
jgi:hypothetical protein